MSLLQRGGEDRRILQSIGILGQSHKSQGLFIGTGID